MFTDATLVLAATAIRDSITHLQLHNGAPGVAGTSNVVGTRVAATGAIDADADITWAGVAFTGLPANQAVTHVSYWSASTGGTYRGSSPVSSGDTAANSAGAYTANVTENGTAS